jgi:hypothetical protein
MSILATATNSRVGHGPAGLTPRPWRVCQPILCPAMPRLMSGSFSSSMKGLVFVSLPDAVSVHIGNPLWANEERCVHREHDDTDGPTVDCGNFRWEVVGHPTHRLFRKEGDCACQCSSSDQCKQTIQTRENAP